MIKYKVINWLDHKPVKFEYQGKWIFNWFSNIELFEIQGNDGGGGIIIYPSIENYYQAMKTFDIQERRKIASLHPAESKRYGKSIKIRPDWEEVKVEIMNYALNFKFQQEPWKTKLIISGIIIEWNNWGDTFWGVSDKTGKGCNVLGLSLMNIRNNLKSSVDHKKEKNPNL